MAKIIKCTYIQTDKYSTRLKPARAVSIVIIDPLYYRLLLLCHDYNSVTSRLSITYFT